MIARTRIVVDFALAPTSFVVKRLLLPSDVGRDNSVYDCCLYKLMEFYRFFIANILFILVVLRLCYVMKMSVVRGWSRPLSLCVYFLGVGGDP